MASRPKRVILTQDPCRGVCFGLSPNGFLYEWLDGLFRLPFEFSGWEVTLVAPQEAGGTFDAQPFRRHFGLAATAQGWARLHSGSAIDPGSDDLLDPLLEADMLVGFELPPYLVAGAVRRDIPFVSVAPAPYRFLPDLLVSVSTNVPELARRLQVHHQSPEALLPAAAIFAAGRRRRLGAPLLSQGRFAVFAGQMAVDAALVQDGRIVSPLDHETAARSIAERMDRLFICPHPYEADLGPLLELAGRLPNAILTRLPLYDLLVSPCVGDVVALSSSVLAEAALMGKTVHRLITCDRDRMLSTHTTGAPILCELPELIGSLSGFLSGRETWPVSTGAGSFRTSLGSDWGLGETRLPDLLVPGDPLICQAPDFHTALPEQGWHPADAFCTWTRSSTAQLLLRLKPADRHRLQVTLHSLPVLAAGPQTVTVRLGSGRQVSHRFDLPGETTLSMVLAPGDLVGGSLLDLVVETDRLQTPISLGVGDDHRLLGVGLRRLLIDLD